jgi:uncharacterized protein
MKRVHDPRRLDVARFVAEGAQLEACSPGAEFGRLAESQSAPQDMGLAPVAWKAAGDAKPVTGGEDECWLRLHAQTKVWLTCQRCLQPLTWPLAVATRIRFVSGEAQAEALDAESEEDVLALARHMDLLALVEDELLLALPLVPRHDSCPQPLPLAAGDPLADASPAPNPFALLAGLKSRGRSDGSSQA